jgi:hypothetical protein
VEYGARLNSVLLIKVFWFLTRELFERSGEFLLMLGYYSGILGIRLIPNSLDVQYFLLNTGYNFLPSIGVFHC